MKLKKIVAAVAAAAMTLSLAAVNAFAATVQLDSEYPGSWGAGKTIPKADLEAIGGDVKVTLTVEWKSSLIADQHILAPMDYDNGWLRITDQLTGDGVYAKGDGFIGIAPDQTTLAFVITADTIATLGDSGIGFQVQNVIVKSADLEAGSPEAAFTILEEDQISDYSQGLYDPTAPAATEEAAPAAEEEAAPAATEEEAAPAAEEVTADEAPAATEAAPAVETAPANTTTAPATGNVAVASIAAVMAVAGAAVVASRKRK